MSSLNDLQGQCFPSDETGMKNLFEIIGMNDTSTIPWNPTTGTFSIPLKVETKDGQITYIITTLPPPTQNQIENTESCVHQNVDANSASTNNQPNTQLLIHQSRIEEQETQNEMMDVREEAVVTLNQNTDLRQNSEVPQDQSQVRLELWNPEISDGLTSINLDHISSSSVSTAPSTFLLDDANNQIFTIGEPTNVSITDNSASLLHPGPGPEHQHTYAAKSTSTSSGSNQRIRNSRFKTSVFAKCNSATKNKDIYSSNRNIYHGRKVSKTNGSKPLQLNLTSKSSQSVQILRSRGTVNRKINYQTPQTQNQLTATVSPKKKRTIADWLAVGIDPTKLEENVDQVRNRFENGCECPGEDENCFEGINPEFVYKHRLNIAELTRAEHDMYLMGALSSTLINREMTETNSKRQRLRNAYIFLGREVCLDAWLYLENCTHYQLKRIRKHLITHGVSARVHGNQGKKPHNTFPFRSYQLAFEFLNNWFSNYVKKSHTRSNVTFNGETITTGYNGNSRNRHPKQNPAPIQLAPEQTRKRLHQDYKKYFEKQAKKAMAKAKLSLESTSNTEKDKDNEEMQHLGQGSASSSDEFKVMGYTSFSQFLKVRFPHVKFAKVELNNAKAISQATAAAALNHKNSNSSSSSTNKTVTSRAAVHSLPLSDNLTLTIDDGESVSVIDMTNCEIEIVKPHDSPQDEVEKVAGDDEVDSSTNLLLNSANQTQFVFSVPISNSSGSDSDPKGSIENESTSIIYMMS